MGREERVHREAKKRGRAWINGCREKGRTRKERERREGANE